MNPFDLLHRRRSEELARRLDADPGSVPVVARLQATAEQLDAVTVPSEDFRADLRLRLLAVAAVRAAQDEDPVSAAPAAQGPAGARAAGARPGRTAVSWRSPSRATGLAAGAMASVVAVTGVAFAGSQSLPGDPFYGVKRTAEALQLQAADGDLEEGSQQLELAATRLGEVRGLVLGREAVDDVVAVSTASTVGVAAASTPVAVGAPVAERVDRTLDDMDRATRRGRDLLGAAFRSSPDEAPLRALASFADRQGAGLEQLLPSLAGDTRERAETSLALVRDIGRETDRELAAVPCGPTCDPGAAAPSAPPVLGPLANPVEPGVGAGPGSPCGCDPAPAPGPAVPPATTAPQSGPPVGPVPGGSPAVVPDPTPAPRPTPTLPPGSSPAPLPTLPSPVPSVPGVPVLPLPPLDPQNPLDPLDPRNPLDPVNPLDPQNPLDPLNPLDPAGPGLDGLVPSQLPAVPTVPLG